MTKILDKYFSRPLLFDCIISAFICFLYWLLTAKFKISLINDQELVKSFTTDIINTSISLAGFVLASLTIIVTFKDNISSKKIKQKDDVEENEETNGDEETGIQLLFTSKHYTTVVGVFSSSVFILLFQFVILSFFKLFIKKFPVYFGDYLLIISLIITSLTVFRCILLLYKIIKLQLPKS